jgi:hypothetical protein
MATWQSGFVQHILTETLCLSHYNDQAADWTTEESGFYSETDFSFEDKV